MDAKFELIAAGSYEDALKAGQVAADKFAQGAKDIKIKATKMKKSNRWKVILTYKRDVDDSTHTDLTYFFDNLI